VAAGVCWFATVAFAAGTIKMPERGICAHRGASGTHPENTLPALEEAVRLGAHMVEVDLALTRDGEIVLMHDATVNRTTDGNGRVLDFDLAAIKRLDAGIRKDPRFAGTRVPTLAEALAVLPKNIWINLDTKADARFGSDPAAVVRRLADLVIRSGRQHQTFMAARSEVAAIARQTAPSIQICSMDRKPDQGDYVKETIARRTQFIQLVASNADDRLPSWIAGLKAAGVRINYFYANKPDEVARLLAAGIDFVLVDHVAAVIPQLKEISPLVPQWK
jgi:glycerophosphoryl diester phosphodiesterase